MCLDTKTTLLSVSKRGTGSLNAAKLASLLKPDADTTFSTVLIRTWVIFLRQKYKRTCGRFSFLFEFKKEGDKL